MAEIMYPTSDRIIEYNYLALQFIKVKKADQPKVLSYSKINDVLNECENKEGNIYVKAAVLLKGLVQKHAFASGNRRTAFITTKEFVLNNHSKFGIKDDPSNARVMTGVRENYYTDDELKEWINNGKIKEFKR
jgi:prophage maintenance system killer protein